MRSMSGHRFTALCVVAFFAGMMGAAADVPVGGRVKGLIGVDPRSLDPHTGSISGGWQAVSGIYSGLLQYDPQNPRDIMPDLAERWDVADAGKVYTFHLRRGVQWHDGAPFTAADVLATFTRLLAMKRREAPCASWLQPVIERVVAPDDHTVRVELKYPAAAFPAIVASPWCRMVARHMLERDAALSEVESQVGTGPFMLQDYEPGRQIVWARNPNYYEALYPYVNEVVHAIFSHRAQWLRAASFGEIFFWSTWAPMSYAQAQELEKARGDEIELYKWPLNTVWTLYLNPKRAPFNTPEMRRAVHLALDRQRLMKAAFEEGGTPCAILPPDIYGDWALSLEAVTAIPGCRQPKDQDVAEARRLVASHYPNGVDVDILVRSVGDYLDRAQLLVPQLRDIGIRARLRTYESSAAWRAYGRGKYDMIGIEDTLVMYPDPSAPFTLLFAADTPYNWSQWTDPAVETLVEKGMRAQEPEKRRQIYRELQQHLLTSDSPTVVVGWLDGWYFRDKRLHRYQPSSIGYGNNGWANVWLGPVEADMQAEAPEEVGPDEADPMRIDDAIGAISPPQAATDDEAAPAVPTVEDETPEQATAMTPPPNGEPTPQVLPRDAPRDAPQEIVMRKVTELFERYFPNGGDFGLNMKANKARDATYIEGDTLSVQVLSDRDVFLRVDYYQANGDVVHLLPNLFHDHRLKAGEIFTLGRPEDVIQFKIAPPFGLELLTVVASQKPFEIESQTAPIEPADAYIERLTRHFETQQSEAHAAIYLPIRTQPAGGGQ